MSYKCFDVSIENNIAHIVMSRPEKRNAMIKEFWMELPEICLLYTSPSPRDRG